MTLKERGTQEGRQERGLERERALLAAVVQNLPAAVVVVRADSGELVLANDEARRIFGEPERVVRAPGAEGRWAARHPDGRAYGAHDWPVLRTLRHGETVTGELMELVRDDGSRALLNVRSSRLAIDAAAPLVLAVFENASERERAEQAQREFVTNAAHELLTPLAAITSAVEVLQAGAKEEPAQRDRFLAHAERETARLGRLARSLLVLARAQMGTEAPSAEVIELAPLLEEVAGGLKPSDAVEVVVECPPELALVTNRELAGQALATVAANAAKFTEQGTIVLRARADGESGVSIEVADSGRGFSSGERRRVFERFYRPSEGPAGDGFGLGLAIARQAVDALGGQIELETAEGVGTTVTLALPGARLVTR